MTESPVVGSIGEWLLESLRATMFRTGPLENQHTWYSVANQQAQAIDTRPLEGVSTHTGLKGEYQLQMVVRDDRVDWLLQPPLQGSVSVPYVPDPAAALDALNEVVARWEQVSDSTVTRLAFGATLSSPVPVIEEAYSELGRYLAPLAGLYTPDTTEILLQINRRRPSHVVSELLINRATNWSVAQYGALEFAMGPDAQPPRQHVTNVRRLELDINTVPRFGATPGAIMELPAVHRVFVELVAMGTEIANGRF